jgi:phosphoglucomutase
MHYNLVEKTALAINLPKSDVLQYVLEDGTKITVRPSGTEPKIKFYVSTKENIYSASEFDSVNNYLTKKIDTIFNDII